MIKLLSIDPGKTTGACIISVRDDGSSFDLVHAQEIMWDTRFQQTYDLFNVHRIDSLSVIVIEAFRLFPGKAMAQIGSEFPSSQMIGAIEAFSFLLNIPKSNILYQTPVDIQSVKIEVHDLKAVADSPHKIDAYRHARLAYIKHFRNVPFVG